ncbi:hypothetical protein BH18VER1_BH18VER1_14940 [soil metagenome]
MKRLAISRWTSAAAVAFLLVSGHAHAAPGDLYVASDRRIYKFNPAGKKNTFATDIYQPVALAFDRVGNLFIANSGAGTDPRSANVLKFSRDGKRSVFATIPSDGVYGMAFDGHGNLFVSAGFGIVKITPSGTQSTFAEIRAVWPLAFDRVGNLYAGVNPTGASSILKFAPDGSSSTFVTFFNSSIIALAFAPDGDLFATIGNSIMRVKPDGSSTTFVTGTRFESNSLAFDDSGSLFAGTDAYLEGDAAILKFPPDGSAPRSPPALCCRTASPLSQSQKSFAT